MGCSAVSAYNETSNKRYGEKEVLYSTKRIKYNLERSYRTFLEKNNLALLIDYIEYEELKKFKHLTSKEIISGVDNERTFKPDGKMLYLYDKVNRICYPILASESKTQGTNKGRLEKGQPEQAQGNACERTSKNAAIMHRLFDHYPFNPYIVIFSGSDFEKGSNYMYSKLAEMNYLNEINKVYIDSANKTNPINIFVREKPWTLEEIYPIFEKVGEHSFLYTIRRYFGYNK